MVLNSAAAMVCSILQEKKQAMLRDEEEQKRLDLEMEIERIRALEAYQVSGGICQLTAAANASDSRLALDWLSCAGLQFS